MSQPERQQSIMGEMVAPSISLRDCGPADSELLLAWGNDPAVRASAFSTAIIDSEEHQAWFARKMVDPHCRIYLAENGQGMSVGQVRFDWEGTEAEIDVTLASDQRGRGLGAALIGEGVARLVVEQPQIVAIHAHIKPENQASLAAFKRAGFSGEETVVVGGSKAIHCVRRTGNEEK
ncbi:MAG: GNAT family N-acetyltransferase [Proteobacteria bacterium]|nr:GNAT family N-acetyltransferase [Pseudomonadota bacterium]MBU1687946.1 GNAT family N-acetyltransferase [Pseudomonadota bacterium]